MRNILIVVDMQNDFIDGVLGTWEAKEIVSKVKEKINGFHGELIYTRDTHSEGYLSTREGRKLPVEHCIRNTKGWQIHDELYQKGALVFDKPVFGSKELAAYLEKENLRDTIGEITLVGVCTDICVISNAMLLKNFLPECEISVDASCCAGVTPQSHLIALEAMKACQINVINSAGI